MRRRGHRVGQIILRQCRSNGARRGRQFLIDRCRAGGRLGKQGSDAAINDVARTTGNSVHVFEIISNIILATVAAFMRIRNQEGSLGSSLIRAKLDGLAATLGHAGCLVDVFFGVVEFKG